MKIKFSFLKKKMDYQALLKDEKLIIDLEKKFMEINIDGKKIKFRLREIRKVKKSKKQPLTEYKPETYNTYSDEESE